jgi:DNA-binding response OmpR family regulator
MLELEELAPEWSVLLAIGDAECMRILAILLAGFEYRVFECQTLEEVQKCLNGRGPTLAVVEFGLSESEVICQSIRERSKAPILVLHREEEGDLGEKIGRRLGASSWERIDAEPEKLLIALQRLAEEAPAG